MSAKSKLPISFGDFPEHAAEQAKVLKLAQQLADGKKELEQFKHELGDVEQAEVRALLADNEAEQAAIAARRDKFRALESKVVILERAIPVQGEIMRALAEDLRDKICRSHEGGHHTATVNYWRAVFVMIREGRKVTAIGDELVRNGIRPMGRIGAYVFVPGIGNLGANLYNAPVGNTVRELIAGGFISEREFAGDDLAIVREITRNEYKASAAA